MRKWLLAGAGLVVLGIGTWQGVRWYRHEGAVSAPVKSSGTSALDKAQPASNVETVDAAQAANPEAGTTPMAERSAIIGVLNKRNGVASELAMKPGQLRRIGDVVVRLRACEQTAPWEADHYTGAFVQVDVKEIDNSWRRVFSGWLYKERPSLNVVQHPIYDVWVKSCTMSFPAAGPDTVVLSDGQPRSSAKKSPDADADLPAAAAPAPLTAPDTTPAIAGDNKAT